MDKCIRCSEPFQKIEKGYGSHKTPTTGDVIFCSQCGGVQLLILDKGQDSLALVEEKDLPKYEPRQRADLASALQVSNIIFAKEQPEEPGVLSVPRMPTSETLRKMVDGPLKLTKK